MKKYLLLLLVFLSLLSGCVLIISGDYSVGKKLFEENKFIEAIPYLEKVVMEHKNNHQYCYANFMLGYSYEQLVINEMNEKKFGERISINLATEPQEYYLIYLKYWKEWDGDYQRKYRAIEGIARMKYNLNRDDNKKLEEVIKYMDENIDYTNRPYTLLLKGHILLQMKKYESAIYWFEKSMNNMESPWKVCRWSQLGISRCYLAMKDMKKAKEAYQQTLVIDPMNEFAKEEIKLTEEK